MTALFDRVDVELEDKKGPYEFPDLKVSDRRLGPSEYRDKNNLKNILNNREILKNILFNPEEYSKLLFNSENEQKDFEEQKLEGFLKLILQNLNLDNDSDLYADTLRFSRDLDQRYFSNKTEKTIFDSICDHIQGRPRLEYMVQTVERAKKTIKKYFNTIYRDLPYVVSLVFTSKECAGHKVDDSGIHELTIETSYMPSKDIDKSKGSGFFQSNYKFQRKVVDLINLIHEYSHGLLSELANKVKDQNNHETQYWTADKTINEGFATLIELETIKLLLRDSKELNLSQSDIMDLQKYKELRMKFLDKRADYKDGYNLIKKVFDEKGIEGVKFYIQNMDRNKNMMIRNDSPEYRKRFHNK